MYMWVYRYMWKLGVEVTVTWSPRSHFTLFLGTRSFSETHFAQSSWLKHIREPPMTVSSEADCWYRRVLLPLFSTTVLGIQTQVLMVVHHIPYLLSLTMSFNVLLRLIHCAAIPQELFCIWGKNLPKTKTLKTT